MINYLKCTKCEASQDERFTTCLRCGNSMDKHQPPEVIEGTKIIYLKGSEQIFQKENWVSLIPEDEGDPRIWEFSLTTGRIIQTKFEE